jgi:hypothetical protein
VLATGRRTLSVFVRRIVAHVALTIVDPQIAEDDAAKVQAPEDSIVQRGLHNRYRQTKRCEDQTTRARRCATGSGYENPNQRCV